MDKNEYKFKKTKQIKPLPQKLLGWFYHTDLVTYSLDVAGPHSPALRVGVCDALIEAYHSQVFVLLFFL